MDCAASLAVISSTESKGAGSDTLVPVSKKNLINKINYINFRDDSLVVVFRHVRFDHTLCVSAYPVMGEDGLLRCRWRDAEGLLEKVHNYRIDHLIVPDGNMSLRVEPRIREVTAEHLLCELPAQCHGLGARKVQRHRCLDVEVQVIQNGAAYHGTLLDFSAASFRVAIERSEPQLFGWINGEVPVQVSLRSGGQVLFSGACLCLKQSAHQERREYVMAPEQTHVRRFCAREHRNARVRLVPAPNASFRHPLTGRASTIRVHDLAAGGMSLVEEQAASVLLVGMIIPELEIVFSNSFRISCSAQVVYRRQGEGAEGHRVYCGLAFLDMEMGTHAEYLSLLQKAAGGCASINGAIDMEALWSFFFETGFIYPEKYAYVQASKEELKETYRRLYMENPTIAKNFTFQENGRILGHFAMLRFYENTWINHHHAAVKNPHNRAGLVVLSQLSHYINDARNLASAHMQYIAGYFRPDNRFPKRFFGGCAAFMNDRKKCSIDPFAYFHYFRRNSAEIDMSSSWSLNKAAAEDLQLLAMSYDHCSGGLTLAALDLQSDMLGALDVDNEYRRLGFRRERHLFSLKREGQLKVLAMVTVSDAGLHMSEVTNAIHLFAVDEEGVTLPVINRMLWLLSAKYDREPVPVLVFPEEFAARCHLPVEKTYNVWTLSTQYTDDYMSYMEQVLHTDRFHL